VKVLYLCGAGNSEGIRLALRINEDQRRWERIVLLDDDPAKHGRSILGFEVAGPFDLLREVDPEHAEVVNLVARSTAGRWSARERVQRYGVPFAPLIHPSVDAFGADLARDLIVYHNATVGPEVSIDEGSVIFMGGVAGHESRMGRCCVVAPNAVLNARVVLGDGAYVGTGAAILPEVTIGPWATVGAGSAVLRNVPAGATVMGVPAKTVLTLDQKLKFGGSQSLPEEIRRELENLLRQTDNRGERKDERPWSPTNRSWKPSTPRSAN
jgi:sugar O-acyltransferase (sialic acid O-acetyltransferase NeuD family)